MSMRLESELASILIVFHERPRFAAWLCRYIDRAATTDLADLFLEISDMNATLDTSFVSLVDIVLKGDLLPVEDPALSEWPFFARGNPHLDRIQLNFGCQNCLWDPVNNSRMSADEYILIDTDSQQCQDKIRTTKNMIRIDASG